MKHNQPIIIKELQNIVGQQNVRANASELYVYGGDASIYHNLPDAVVQPKTINHVQKIMEYANAKLIPVVPRGAGSGLCGHTVPIEGGVILDMKRMNHLLEVKPEDMYCRVEPGVVDEDLNRVLKPYGLFYPPSPSSSKIATIGGEISTNASGSRSVKYGATRDYVLGMKLVLPTGELVDLGTETRVEAAGYQIHRLITGSEGTLGVIVEATMKLIPLPKLRCLGMAKFDKLEDCGDAIADIIASGVEPSMLELVDEVAIKAVNTTFQMELPEVEAIVFFEADGKVKEAVDYEIEAIKGICEKHNGKIIRISYATAERKEIYSARKKLSASLARYKENHYAIPLADDMAIPYSKMAECFNKIHKIAERYNLIMAAFGHAGSGVIHIRILLDTKNKEQWQFAKQAIKEVYEYVHSIGGISSGEHGIALSKAPAWKSAKEDLQPVMRKIKRALDPNNILNPQKLMDAPDDWLTATPLRYSVKE